MKILISILIVLCLVSCSSLTIVRDKLGKVVQVKGRGLQQTEVKPDGTVKHTMKIEWYPKDVLTIYKD